MTGTHYSMLKLARIVLCIGLSAPLFGCYTTKEWTTAHGDVGALGRAASPTNPNHLGSGAILLAMPYLLADDHGLSDDIVEDRPLNTKKWNADTTQRILALSPFGAAALSAVFPDPGYESEALEVFEVAVESALITAGLTELLKAQVGRERPDPETSSTASFPSGHVSSSMAGATVTARWLRRKHPAFFSLELGLYAGVGYVAFSRIENQGHFPSDTAAGAILGGYVANTLWDAHFGRDEKEGFFHHMRGNIYPAVIDDEGLALFWTLQF